jgi:3-oxoadipate enol-lactonase
MPTASVNSTTINYTISGPPTGPWLVLINGLADDLQTWSANIPAFTAAGYRVLANDNRGIGLSSRPKGPFTAEILAADLHALLVHLDVERFHLLGVSMGGMVAQTYAMEYPNASIAAEGREMLSLSLCCTYAAPSAFCERMFGLWGEMAVGMGVRGVMRDVTLWAFTVPFFRGRTGELEAVEEAMEGLDMSLGDYLAQLNVIQKFDSVGKLGELEASGKSLGEIRKERVMVLAGEEDILIPVVLSRELCEAIPGSVWRTTRGGHGCLVSWLSGAPRISQPTNKFAVGVSGRVQQNCARVLGDFKRADRNVRLLKVVLYMPVIYILHYAKFLAAMNFRQTLQSLLSSVGFSPIRSRKAW